LSINTSLVTIHEEVIISFYARLLTDIKKQTDRQTDRQTPGKT